MNESSTCDDCLRVGPTIFWPAGFVRFEKYASRETAIAIVGQYGEQLYVATVALVPSGVPHPGENAVWLKGWSENAGVPEALVAAGVVTLTGRTASSGYVTAQHAELTERARKILDRKRIGSTSARTPS